MLYCTRRYHSRGRVHAIAGLPVIFLALVAGQTSAAAATPLAEFVETLTEGCIPGASPLPSKFFGFLGDTPLAVEGSFPTFTITLADGKELSLFGQSCASLVLPPKLTIDVVSCTTTLVKFDIRANGAVKVRLKDDGACFPKGTGVGSGGEPTASDVKFTVTYRPGEGDPDVQVTGNFSVPIKDVSLGPVPIVISQATVTLGSTGIGLKDVSVAFTGFLSFLNNRVTVLDARIGKAGFSGTIALKSG